MNFKNKNILRFLVFENQRKKLRKYDAQKKMMQPSSVSRESVLFSFLTHMQMIKMKLTVPEPIFSSQCFLLIFNALNKEYLQKKSVAMLWMPSVLIALLSAINPLIVLSPTRLS